MTRSSVRDPRLDFFRGAALFIIFIAHSRGNALWDWIPARFGFSDAANLFVFCSGCAAAVAFGGTFLRQGMLIGTARIAYRCAQLYLGHLMLFFGVAALAVLATGWFGRDYVELIGIGRFFHEPMPALVDLVTLRYVPHYFDILPLYIAVLAMVPVAMLLARLNVLLVPVASVALYATAQRWRLNFLADAGDGRGWYFDPFAWQLIFFTGFCLMGGWLPVPRRSRLLTAASLAMVALGILVTQPIFFEHVALLDRMLLWINGATDKTYLDLIQYAHFLATAYLATVLLAGREAVLLTPALKPIFKCGQQALAVFLSGMVLSHLSGMVFDRFGTGGLQQIVVNAIVFGALIGIAFAVAWFKAAPWKRAPAAVAPTLALTNAAIELRAPLAATLAAE